MSGQVLNFSSRRPEPAPPEAASWESVPSQPALRIGVAGALSIARDGLCELLRAAHFEVAAEVSDGVSAVRMALEQRPDILLLDLPIAERNELELIREAAAAAQPGRTLVIAGLPPREFIVKVLQLGAAGVLPRSSTDADTLNRAIQWLASWHFWIGDAGALTLVEALRRVAPALNGHRPFGLTGREMEIIAAVLKGASNAEVAGALALSPHTVKHHLRNIYDKTGAGNRVELALFATHHQLIRKGA